MTDAVVPSWEGVRETRLARLQRVDVRLVIAVLIGLVSVTGAVITWKSSQLGEKAVDRDRQAIAETVLQEQSNANVETRLRDEQQAFAQYKEDLTNAQLLDTEADQLVTAGLTAQAAQARDEAGVQREVANDLASLTFSVAYVKVDDATGLPTDFLLDKRRSDLRQNDDQAAKVNPEQTVAQAIDFRRRSQRLEGWTIPLVLAVVLLTVATIMKNARARPWIATGAVVIYLLSAGIAIGWLSMPEIEAPEIEVDEDAPTFRRRLALAVVLITLFGAGIAYLHESNSNLEDNAAPSADRFHQGLRPAGRCVDGVPVRVPRLRPTPTPRASPPRCRGAAALHARRLAVLPVRKRQ